MTRFHVTKIHITLLVKVPEEILSRHLASSASVVGEELTQQITQAIKSQHLGYFPALDFFQNQGSVDAELIDAAETIGWFAAKYAREEVQRKLRPFFSSLQFQSVQTTAFTMPPVRPNQLNAWHELVEHYTPNSIKLDIMATLLKKQDQPQGVANWAKQLFRRNLESVFPEVTVVQTSLM